MQSRFSAQLETLIFKNIQFTKPDQEHNDPEVIKANVYLFLKEMLFKPELHNLKTLSFTSIAEGGALIENLHVLLDEFKQVRNFTNSLENLELNGTTLDTDGVHQILNSVLMKLPNL